MPLVRGHISRFERGDCVLVFMARFDGNDHLHGYGGRKGLGIVWDRQQPEAKATEEQFTHTKPLLLWIGAT